MAWDALSGGEGLFKMAIAVAPVTSWRYYDSIYTENFNGLPDDYPKGYDDNSPVNLAHLFRDDSTRLLIVHGTADDNVHFQNTVEMTRALNRCGKQYDMMVYPRPEPFDDARRYDTRPREDAPLYVGKFVTGKKP